uniref:Uncharacterized protein n=1 Tax=Glossina palpalis gambiensis TaxID=67801 RepID=A0A1B0BQV7_9MUSC
MSHVVNYGFNATAQFKEKKTFYWLDMQHIAIYCLSNEVLMQSLIDSTPTKYDLAMTVRLNLLEENLEQLLTRSVLKADCLKNELELMQMAIGAYQRFEIFYKTCDEALIDWKLLMDDLMFLAQYLQSAGYLERSSYAWLLLHKTALLVQDDYTALKSSIFMCDYVDFIDVVTPVLLAILQIAYYYARCSRYAADGEREAG